MLRSRIALPVLLYFYQGELTQEDADVVVSAFPKADVHFRKVYDINDTRDLVEKCAHAAGTIPLIYFVRNAEGVLTDGVLADPLDRPNSHKPTASVEVDTVVQKTAVEVSTGHVQPTDANINALLLKDEIETAEAVVKAPEVKSDDVVADTQSTAVPVATAEAEALTAAPVAVAPTPVAPVAVAPKTTKK